MPVILLLIKGLEHYGERSWVKIVVECLRVLLNPKMVATRCSPFLVPFSHSVNVGAAVI